MEDISKELLNRVDILAQKIGTSVEYLFPKFCQLVQLEASIALIGSAFIFIIAIVVSYFGFTRYNKFKKWTGSEGDIKCQGVGLIILAAFFIVTAMIITGNFLPRLIIPEPFAVQQILNALK